jgi:hypothetical protein
LREECPNRNTASTQGNSGKNQGKAGNA